MAEYYDKVTFSAPHYSSAAQSSCAAGRGGKECGSSEEESPPAERFQGPDSHFLAPLYRFSKEDFRLWIDRINEYVEQKNLHVYAEEALNELLPSQIELHPVYFEDETCMEINDFDDLQEGKKLLSKK